MRLATFNLKHGATTEGYFGHPERVTAACADLRADILALQEVEKGVLRSRFADMAALAAAASGMEVVFVPTMKTGLGTFGNALLVRGKITDVEVLELRGGPRTNLSFGGRKIPIGHEPRNAIIARVHTGEGPVSLAVTHLPPEKDISQILLPTVLGALGDRPGPRVIMGDFNRNRREVLAEPYLDGMELVDGPPTFPALNPTRSIDHIAVSGLAICAVKTVHFAISDHLALVADVKSLSGD